MTSPADLRQKLHQYIDVAGEDKLQAIYVLLEDDIEYTYGQEDIAELQRRRDNHLKGISASYSVETMLETVRKQA
jgi:hypothetical protein